MSIYSQTGRRKSSLTGLPTSGSSSRRSSFSARDFQIAQGAAAQAANKMWSNLPNAKSHGLLIGRQTFGPAFLLIFAPIFAFVYVQAILQYNGSFKKLTTEFRSHGLVNSVLAMWPSCRQAFIWKFLAVFYGFQILLAFLVPGYQVHGPVTPSGYTPTYTTNGWSCFIMTLMLYTLGALLKYYPGGVLWANLGAFLASENIIAIAICILLYFKGLILPSTHDQGSSGDPIFDFYWGTELHPRILGLDFKQFLTRSAMTLWALLIISAVLRQSELHGVIREILTSAGLQLAYIIKFHWWEDGYLQTMDIQHERAGFYRIWGVLVFMPAVYLTPVSYLVKNMTPVSRPTGTIIFLLGLTFIYLTYNISRQKDRFRLAGGNLKIWGHDPFFITAKYKLENGDGKSALILGSGWYGLSRHPAYIFELLTYIAWTLPCYTRKILPYFPILFLAVLLLDRVYRVEARCLSKYGHYWLQYCARTPNYLISNLF